MYWHRDVWIYLYKNLKKKKKIKNNIRVFVVIITQGYIFDTDFLGIYWYPFINKYEAHTLMWLYIIYTYMCMYVYIYTYIVYSVYLCIYSLYDILNIVVTIRACGKW